VLIFRSFFSITGPIQSNLFSENDGRLKGKSKKEEKMHRQESRGASMHHKFTTTSRKVWHETEALSWNKNTNATPSEFEPIVRSS
jgi:hypothetical protein